MRTTMATLALAASLAATTALAAQPEGPSPEVLPNTGCEGPATPTTHATYGPGWLMHCADGTAFVTHNNYGGWIITYSQPIDAHRLVDLLGPEPPTPPIHRYMENVVAPSADERATNPFLAGGR